MDIGLTVIMFLVQQFAGKKIGDWLSDRDKCEAFGKAMEAALDDLRAAGGELKGYGVLDDSFLKSEPVRDHIWAVLLEPNSESRIDYQELGAGLEGIYEGFKADPATLEQIEYFVDSLMDRMNQQPPLRDLLAFHILQQHDCRLTLLKKKRLVREYLDREGREIARIQQEFLGEGKSYVEPLIEIEEEERRERPRFPGRQPDGDGPLMEEREGMAQSVDIDQYFTTGPDLHMAVVNESGFGKSTLLRELFRRLANRWATDGLLPVLWGPKAADSCTPDRIRTRVIEKLRVEPFRAAQVETLVSELFDEGNIVFLIDALDQMSSQPDLMGCFEDKAFRGNRVVLTSRPEAFDDESGLLNRFRRLSIRPFGKDRWEEYLGEERLVQLQEVVDDEFLKVPILLKLVSEHWPAGDEQTERLESRAELYGLMMTDLLKRQEERDAARKVDSKTPGRHDVRRELRKLAYEMMVKGYRGQFPREEACTILGYEWLRWVESWGGIIDLLEPGEYMAFRHRSFQEYLAAECLKAAIEQQGRLPDELAGYLYHPDWTESLRFLAGLLPRDMAVSLVERIMSPPEGAALIEYREHLRIAALCLREMGEAGQAWRERIVEQCREDIETEHPREWGFRVLTALRDEMARGALIELIRDKDEGEEVRREAVEALGELKALEAVPALIELIKDKDAAGSAKWGAVEALGELKALEAVPALIELIKDKDAAELAKRAAAEALGKMKAVEAVPALIELIKDSGTDSSVKSGAGEALDELKAVEAVPMFIELTKGIDLDEEIRGEAVEALGELKALAVPALIELIKDKDAAGSAKWGAVEALGKMKAVEAVPALIELIKDKDADVSAKRRAAEALGKLKAVEAVPTLIELIKDKDADVSAKEEAARALGKMKAGDGVPALIELIKASGTVSRLKHTAAWALGKMKAGDGVPALIELIKDSDSKWIVKHAAIWALGEIEAVEAASKLKELIKDKDSDSRVKWDATWALVKMKAVEAVPMFIELTKGIDLDEEIRGEAAEALGKMKAIEAAPALVELIRDRDVDDGVREPSAWALGEMKAVEAVPVLIELIRDKGEGEGVRGEAARALAEMKAVKAVPVLIELIGDKYEGEGVRGRAVSALGKMKAVEAVPVLIELIRDKDEGEEVRREAVSALGEMKAVAAAPTLVELIRDRDVDDGVREPSAWALGDMKAVEAVPALIELIKDEDADALVRWGLAMVIARIGGDNALSLLTEACGDGSRGSGRLYLLEALEAVDRRLREKGPVDRIGC